MPSIIRDFCFCTGVLYSVFLAKGLQSMTVAAVAADPGASILVTSALGTSQALLSGVVSGPIPVAAGSILTLTVTVSYACLDMLIKGTFTGKKNLQIDPVVW
jgi:hypothetical protein